MISKLPKWIWAGAGTLAFDAGIINVIGFLSFEHQAVTHLTGTTSLLAAALADLDVSAAIHFGTVIGSFLLGTILSGILIPESALKLAHRYGTALFIESLLLCGTVPLLNQNNIFGIYLAASACGLQNAMMSTYSGAVIRTSHLSGMFTDLGIFIGHILCGLHVDARRVRLCLLIIGAFTCGGIVGTLAFRHLHYSALFIPAGITGIAALFFEIFRRQAD